MRPQIRVEGPSDRTIVSAILRKFSLERISIPSGHGLHKGKDSITQFFEEIIRDDRYNKFLFLLDENAREKIQQLARRVNPDPDRAVFVLFVPGLETWTRQLLPPEKQLEYDQKRHTYSKRDLAVWASRQFRRSDLEPDKIVQALLRFCRCETLQEYRFPTVYQSTKDL